MGIDIHAFNFIKMQADNSPLGSVLTIGRQSLSVGKNYIKERLGITINSADGYCEPLLTALNATDVASIDFSDYEGATYVGDLNNQVTIESEFDTIIDAGSLEHIFDTTSAFKNLVEFCRIGGRIIHILPVNNLSGHGFWQFSSDLIYSVYCERNGFRNAQVYYASGLDFSVWYKIPKPKPGYRVELVSLEPVILLSVAEKSARSHLLSAVQPFYLDAWKERDASTINANAQHNRMGTILKKLSKRRGRLVNFGRNFLLVSGLASGHSRFSIKNSRFEKVFVDDIFRGSPK